MKRSLKDLTIQDIGSFLFFFIALPGLSIYLTIFAAGHKDLTALESGLLQLISILSGVATAYRTARNASEKVVQERAKLALRRIFTLYTFFPRFIQSIENQRHFLESMADQRDHLNKNYVDQALNALTTQAYEQIGTVNDAVEDWKDLVPHPEEVLSRYQEGKND